MRNHPICFHVELNKELMKCQDVNDLVELCEDRFRDFNSVNVSTALNRLAKLKNDNLDKSSFDARLKKAIELVKSKALQVMMEFKSRELANILWALATIGAEPGPDLLKKVLCRSVALANSFKPQEII